MTSNNIVAAIAYLNVDICDVNIGMPKSLAKALVCITFFRRSEGISNNNLSVCDFYSPTHWDVKSSCIISVKKLLHFALLNFASKSCHILSQKVVTFRVKKLLHFVLKFVTFRVDVTICVNCYISVAVVSAISFWWFWWFRFGGFVLVFRVLAHARESDY